MAEADPHYLIITGTLLPNNRLNLQPGFTVTSTNDVREEPTSRLIAVLIDIDGRSLLRFGLPMSQLCVDGVYVSRYFVAGKVPIPSQTATIRFERDGIAIHQIDVPKNPPSVRITWDPGGAPDGVQVVTWEAEHPDGNEIHFVVCYAAEEGKWQPLTLVLQARQFELDLTQLPGGEHCRVGVLASDGVNTVLAESQPFYLPPRLCQSMILEPNDGAEFAFDAPITFRGQGYYLEENSPELRELIWHSSVDGEFGKGSLVRALLSPGNHQITLTAGTGDRSSSSRISISIAR